MAQIQAGVSRASSFMKPVINRYGVQLLMPHFVPMDQPKESVAVSKELIIEILEEEFQIVGLNVVKALEYVSTLITSMTN